MQYGKFIEVTGEDSKRLLFLARAVYKELDIANKAALRYIFLDKGETEGDLLGVASDGKSLHSVILPAELVERLGLHEGYWKVLKNKERKKIVWLVNINEPENNSVFPNYKKVIPSGEAKHKIIYKGFEFDKYASRYTVSLAKFFRELPDLTVLNPDYLLMLGGGEWEAFWYGQDKAVKFVKDDYVCAIMPYSLDFIEEED